MKTEKSFILGILGPIGSGKSAAAKLFEKKGFFLINADEIAHEALVEKNIREMIIKEFGNSVTADDGSIERSSLAAAAFKSRRDIGRLNAIIHPYVRGRMEELIGNNVSRKFVLDVPLLLEADMTGMCDYIVYLDTREEIRYERLRASRNWDGSEIKRRGRFQSGAEEKKNAADAVLDNNGSIGELEKQVNVLLLNIFNDMEFNSGGK